MLQLARPKDKASGTFDNSSSKFSILLDYCIDDVLTEREVGRKLGELNESEREYWLLDQKMNRAGIPIDVDLVKGAIKITADYTAKLEEQLLEVTKGKLANIRQTAKFQLWLEEQGVLVPNVQKATLAAVLERPNLPPVVRTALSIRAELGLTSVRKFSKMAAMLDSDDMTVKDQFLYHGASTGRTSGKGIQAQNLPRGSITPTEEMFKAVTSGSWRQVRLYGPVMEVLTSCIRGAIKAPEGHKMIVSDFSNIEGRVLAWLAGENWKVNAFRDFDAGVGPDIYKLAYAVSFDMDVDDVSKDDRQVGKVLELSLGFGGGIGAFQNMAGTYGVEVTDKQADELKILWRKEHPATTKLWKDYEQAAMKCTITGERVQVGRIWFERDEDFLYMKLPSGRRLSYYKPAIDSVETPWGQEKNQLTYYEVNSLTRQWTRNNIYGGKWAENACQSVARDLLFVAMKNLDDEGLTPFIQVHDEAGSIVPNDSDITVDAYDRIMERKPAWAAGLPLAAEGWEGTRYKKD
jgi:DNA polymerase